DVNTLRMDRLDTSGEAPGWIYEHRAVAVSPRGIRIWGGIVVNGSDSTESHEQNLDAFVLDLNRLLWHRESTPGPRVENRSTSSFEEMMNSVKPTRRHNR